MNDVEKVVTNKLYKINIEEFESRGSSFSYAIYNRMSEEGKGEANNLFEGIPIDISLGNKLMKIISDICSKNDEYILPGTTVSEAIFRILIANQNEPLSVLDIHSRLANAWSSVIYLKNLSENVVTRVLEGPSSYCFIQTQ
ncbi:MAG: hypothetical protein CL780_02435 [Chloroflexi bacterium]|nr:hypothetical protein [Chloroflexota bacterium]|tara:strand:- start:282 stop:704 length:423 start_codon:yes stop_codon:yes gene_type:complete